MLIVQMRLVCIPEQIRIMEHLSAMDIMTQRQRIISNIAYMRTSLLLTHIQLQDWWEHGVRN